MKRREQPASGYLFNGKTYPTETEYLAAREKWRARRARLLANLGYDESGYPANA